MTEIRFFNEEDDLTQRIVYSYDVFDYRTARAVVDDADVVIEKEFRFYDGDRVVMDVDGSAAITHRYLIGADGFGILAQENVGPTTNDTLWLLTDDLGSTRAVVDDSGTVTSRYQYDAFGNVLDSSDPPETRILYTGLEWDAVAQTWYAFNRDYESTTQRWLRNDPIGFDAGDPNLSRYVGNSPIMFVDRDGLQQVYGPQPDPNVPYSNPGSAGSRKVTINAPPGQNLSGNLNLLPLRPEHQPGQNLQPPHPMMNPGNVQQNSQTNAFFNGARYGLAKSGQVLTWPARWLGADFSSQDEAMRNAEASIFLPDSNVSKMTDACAVIGGGATLGAVGGMTASRIQGLIASSGDRVVTVFTRLTQSPAANRVLHASPNQALCNQMPHDKLFQGRIPYDLFQRLLHEKLIHSEMTRMNNVTDTAYRIEAGAMPFLQQYFKQVGGN